MKNRNHKKIISRSLIIAAMFLAFIFALGGTAAQTVQAAGDINGNYYYADFDNAQDAYDAGNRVNKELIAEGITMLKNENSLPLAQGAKVSVFGKRSVGLLYGGAGSGAGSGGATLSIQDSLAQAGIEVNAALTDFYKDNSKSGTLPTTPLRTYGVFAGPNTGIGETPVATLSANVNESTYETYNDAAIIVLSRAGCEAGDLPKGMSTGFSSGRLNGTPVTGARNYDDHYLQPDANETALIQYVGDHFDNVIIVLNSGSQMEVGFLDDPGHYAYHKNIKGALWIGFPGTGDGFKAFGEVIAGKINPSGHTTDTYARDFKSDPTWSNLATYTNDLFVYNNLKIGSTTLSFAKYQEGIYSGYRYYETRGYTEGEEVFTGTVRGTSTTQWDSWYKANVVYPFGYGLSYTTFKWELVSSSPDANGVLDKDGRIQMTVDVTNTGNVAGKDVVQMYYTSPYTAGGIEKAYVVLGGYEKTELLQPNETQRLTVSMNVRDMASYDNSDANTNGFKGYELEAGQYTVSLSKNAHESVLSTTFMVNETYKYDTAKNTGEKVENLFDDVSAGIGTTLSRNNWTGTWPTEPTASEKVASQDLIDLVENTSLDNKIIAYDDPSRPYYQAEMPQSSVDSGIKLIDLYGLPITDPNWDKFVQQFPVGNKSTAGSLASILWNGGWTLNGNSAFGMPTTSHEDGPSGLAGREVKGSYTSFASETITAATWNKNLAYKKGLILGSQAMIGGTKQVNGLYAPACNIHRSQFGGRNFEYFSEDGYISGVMAGEIIRGCNEKGLVTFLKHFAVNDQESNRDKLLTWATEQTMREIYFRPFQICVEDYNSHGIMTALNSIGGVWTGGHYNLNQGMLRKEWGFDGMIITDYVQSRSQLNGNQCIRGGGDFLLATSGSVQTPSGLDQPTTVANMQRAMKNICYTLVNHTAIFNKSNMNILGSFVGGTLDFAIDGLPYEGNVATAKLADGNSGIKYALQEGSKLPVGLTLHSDGSITGTAAAQQEASVFTVVASYGMATREATFTLPVIDRSTSVIYMQQNNVIAPAYVGKEYVQKVDWAYTIDGGEHEITYSLDELSIMPRGLTLSSDGIISGTPQTAISGYKLRIIASAEGMRSMAMTIMLSTYKSEYVFSGRQIKDAKFNESYFDSVKTVGGEDLTYSLKAGSTLPKGLRLTPNGNIVGTPLETVLNNRFTVQATGRDYLPLEAEYSISIAVNYENIVLDNAMVGAEYKALVNYAQGATDVMYSIESGTLPTGLTLTSDGTLSGTASNSGNYVFTVQANSETALSDAIQLTLAVENNISARLWTTGLIIGIVGVVLAISGSVFYVLVIDRKNYVNGASKLNKGFIAVAASIIGVLLASVITCGMLFSPISIANGGYNTFTFEAEYVYLDEFMGAGISNSGEGTSNIYGDGTEAEIEKGWSNGYFLGNTYAKNSITFNIVSDKAAKGTLVLRLASELGNLALNNNVFGVEVNGEEIDYSITVINSSSGNYNFADYPLGTSLNLVEGANTVTLTIKDNALKDGNSIGAPLIDCIRISTDAELSWTPLTENTENRGQI